MNRTLRSMIKNAGDDINFASDSIRAARTRVEDILWQDKLSMKKLPASMHSSKLWSIMKQETEEMQNIIEELEGHAEAIDKLQPRLLALANVVKRETIEIEYPQELLDGN